MVPLKQCAWRFVKVYIRKCTSTSLTFQHRNTTPHVFVLSEISTLPIVSSEIEMVDDLSYMFFLKQMPSSSYQLNTYIQIIINDGLQFRVK